MTTASTIPDRTRRHSSQRRFKLALPCQEVSLSQDAEWCVVRVGDEWQEVRFHDYPKLFSIPGLYEQVIYELLKCNSPRIVCDLLRDALRAENESVGDLRVLDLGAGNGIVAELLRDDDADFVVGVDIIEEAAMAARRDRPGVYYAYHVVDLTALSDGDRRELEDHELNCLACVAALGFGDIPTEAFKTAFNLVRDGGWVAFNIKAAFLDDLSDRTGFAEMIRQMIAAGVLDVRRQKRYTHRLGTDRQPLTYVAFAGRKTRNLE